MENKKESHHIDDKWLKNLARRLNVEVTAMPFFYPDQLNNLRQKLSSLSLEELEKFQHALINTSVKFSATIGSDYSEDQVWELLILEIQKIWNPLFADIVSVSELTWLLDEIRSNKYLFQELRAMLQSGSIDLKQGLKNWREDVEAGAILPDTLRPDLFNIGTNLAVTSGEVIFENQLFQLIQYRSATKQVFANPILIIPAFVNRFYILDLSPENSMVKWLTEQGHTVFIMSWINPSFFLADYGISNYVLDGALVALDQIGQRYPKVQLQVMGYCAGGLLAAILTAFTRSSGDNRISSLTLLTTLLDYSEAGRLSKFVTTDNLSFIKKQLKDLGYLPAEVLLRAFAILRPNELLFGRILKSYVLGKRRKPSPLLHWLGDGTRTPASLVLWVMEELYLNNQLVKSPWLEIAGKKIDLKTIDCPVFLFGANEDDISPWKGAFLTATYLSGKVTAVLGEGGHNSGIIVPPSVHNRNHYIMHPDHLFDFGQAELIQSSWWITWANWLIRQAGEMTDPPMLGDKLRPTLEQAPGRYVKQS